MRTITPELTSLLQGIEKKLLLPQVRRDRHLLETIFAEDFREIAVSGRVSDREAVIDRLTSEAMSDGLAIEDFVITILTIDHHGNDVAMSSYISKRTKHSGELIHRSRRTSIWLRFGDAWRMRFHQATVLE